MGLMGLLPTPPLCANHTLSQHVLQTPDSDYNKRQFTYQLLMDTAERAHNEMQKWVEAGGWGWGGGFNVGRNTLHLLVHYCYKTQI